ncbi:MCE family protein [Mycolicibacterium fortuitum]
MKAKIHLPIVGFVIFVVVAVVLTTLVYGSLRRDTAGPTDAYSALFTDVTGLREGDDVRVAGVRVGRVDTVALDGDIARVMFRLQRDQQIYPHTVVSVRYQNIVGQRYLGLLGGPRGPADRGLPPGSELGLDQTEPSFDVGALLNGFEPLFTLLDPQQADALSQALIDAFQGDSGAITSLVVQATEVSAVFAERDEVLHNMITGLNAATENLARQDANFDSVVTNARRMITELNLRRQTLVDSVGSLTGAAARLATIGESVYPQLSEFAYREPGIAKHIVSERDQIAFLGANLPLLLKGLARVSQEGSYGNAYVCSLNMMGFFPGLNNLVPRIVELASPGNVVKQSQKCRPAQ